MFSRSWNAQNNFFCYFLNHCFGLRELNSKCCATLSSQSSYTIVQQSFKKNHLRGVMTWIIFRKCLTSEMSCQLVNNCEENVYYRKVRQKVNRCCVAWCAHGRRLDFSKCNCKQRKRRGETRGQIQSAECLSMSQATSSEGAHAQ